MEENSSNKSIIRKYATRIVGLDRLLYGGLDLQNNMTVVAIEGEDEVERSLLGLQIMYGVGQSIYSLCNTDKERGKLLVHHISCFSSCKYAEDLMMNIIISSNIRKLMEMYVSSPKNKRDEITNIMSALFFDVENIVKGNRAFDEIANNRLVNMVEERTDYLLGKEVLYYSNRTNGIHLRSVKGCKELEADSDEDNLLFKRRTKIIQDLFPDENKSEDQNKKLQHKIDQYNTFFGNPFIKVKFDKWEDIPQIEEKLTDKANDFVVAVNLSKTNRNELSKLVEFLNKHREDDNNPETSKVRLMLLILPKAKNERIPDHLVDMRIEMKNIWDDNYQYKYLTIAKSRRQNRVLGMHQYKQKDYGIEIYPNIHTYHEQRRYLQRALVFTHSDAITDTYQQYIDTIDRRSDQKIGYREFVKKKEEQADKYFSALYPKYDSGMSSVDVLDRIMLSQANPFNVNSRNALDEPLGYQGCVTAIIGEPNSYKRFLTFGSIFSSSISKEHTLVLLMNKDYTSIRRHLSCPARVDRAEDEKKCMKCYEFIHFMETCMGKITPEEFIYYFVLQLDTSFQDGRKLSRVVIDDLQMVDFCFPELSKQSKMFLPTLISVCKEKGISLYIICDKESYLVDSLRALSDNVVCTDKGSDGQLMIHIERYAGYHNSPSIIRSCLVKKAKHLFECYEKIDDDDNTVTYFEFNNQQIDSKSEPTLRNYWNFKEKL